MKTSPFSLDYFQVFLSVLGKNILRESSMSLRVVCVGFLTIGFLV